VAVANVVAKFEADISDVQAKMAALKKSFQDAGDSTTALSSRLKTVGTEMSKVGKGMTIGITLPLAAIGAAAVKASVDFESSMSKIVGLVGIASDEVKAMQQEVLALSGATAKSPVELADALFVVTSAGLRGEQAMQALEQSAKAGAAGLGQTNDIARAVAGALSAYGSDVLSAADATDQIVATARAGNFETSQFAAAIGRVLPFAQQAGASFAEMGGAVALLTRVNGDAAQSVTQIAALFRAFVVPTEEAKKGLQEVGLSAQALRDSIAKQGLPATLQMLDKALGGNREQLGRILGSSEAASAAFQILGADAYTLSETFGVVADSAGMTQEAFDAAADTAGFKMQQAMVQLQAVLIEIGDIIVPLVTEFAKFAKTVLEGFQLLPGPAKNVIVAFAGIAAVLGPIVWVAGKVVASMAALSGAFIATRARAVLAFRQISASVKATQIQIQTSMIAARTSMGALVAGARAAGAGFVATFRTMTGALRSFMAALGPVGIAIIGASVAYEVFVGAQQEAEDKVNSLTDAMKEQNAVMGEAVALQLAQDLQELAYGFAENTKFVDDLAALGLTLDEVIMALMQGGDAMQQLTARVNDAAAGNDNLRMAAGNVLGTLAMENDAVSQARAQYESYNTAKALAAKVTGEVDAQTRNMTSATVSAAIAAGNAMGPTSGFAGSLTEVKDAAGNVVTELDVMRQEYQNWLSVTGQISAVDAAAASIDNLGKASVEFGTDLMGQTPKARDFRGEVVKAFEDSAAAAASLSDDIPTQRAIFTGELIKIVNALKASGVKPKDIESFLGAMDDLPASVSDIMRSAAQAIGDTNFKTEVEKAFDKSVKAGAPMTADAMERLATGASDAAKAQLGLTLEPELASIIKSGTTALRPTAFNNGQLTGKSIGSGLANGISASSPIVQAAVARVIAQAKAAADAAAESQSPSRLFARTGDDMVLGIAMGWLRMSPTLIRAITSIIPRAKGESSKLARSMAEAFASSLRDNGGSVASAIGEVFGSIPTETPLEAQLGVKGAEKFINDNKKALSALLELGEAIDRINEKVVYAGEAFASLGDLLARPFGRESQITEMFGSEADIDSVIDGFLSIRDQVKQAYAVLTDASIVGAQAAARNRAEMQATIAQLRNLTAQAVTLREQYDTVMKALETLEKDYQASIAKTNAFYDAAEKKAEENIKAIEDRWGKAIPALDAALKNATEAFDKENAVLQRLINERDQFVSQIKSGFRSFVNSLSFESSRASKQIVKETKRLANGITVTLERELEVGGGPAAIRQTLEERLAAVRDFSRNIRTLMQRGLDPALVRDFVSAGVSGAGDAAAALAAGSQEDIAAINSVQSQLLSEADDFGKYASAQWHDIGVAQQQAIVTPLEVARDAAQKALTDANALRDRELAAARAQLDKLRTEREAALTKIDEDYNKAKSDLETQAAALQAQMDAVAAQIEEKILTMLNTTATRSAEAGVKAGQKLLEGFRKEYPKVYDKLNRLMDQLAASLTRTATVTVQTVYQAVMPVTPPPTGKVPKRAMGGPVAARTAYLVGERGPELFIPGFSGNIIPNNQLGTVPAMGARGGSSGGTVINVTVNAGMGANGDDIGRQVVDSLRRYERRNGPIPVKVTG
jgi:TP901 family phage tail tape measure protein